MSKLTYAKKTLGDKDTKKVVIRSFTPETWSRLGKEKGGWEKISKSDYDKLLPKKTGTASNVVKPEELDSKVPDGGKGADVGDGGTPEVKGIAGITIPDVIVHLKTLKTSKEVDEYIGDDTRVGVKNAATERKEEIEKKGE